jgi:hypothetical protein
MAGQSIRCSGPALAEEEFNEALCCIDNTKYCSGWNRFTQRACHRDPSVGKKEERTVARLFSPGSTKAPIMSDHISEAIQYRSLDRQLLA